MANAVKFTEQGSVTLTVRASPLADRRYSVDFTVRDSGVGIRQEDLARIFEPFIQSDNAVSKEGTGLGLAISREFVGMMGGALTVESALGAGSVFHFALALETCGAAADSPSKPAADSAQAPLDSQGQGEPVDQAALREQLARLPLETRTALRTGLQKLDLGGVALILASIKQEHPAAATGIAHLLRRHRYPMLCSLLDEVQDVT